MSDFELRRAAGVTAAVEERLANEAAYHDIVEIDPRVALMYNVCGPACHYLAGYLRAKRGHKYEVLQGMSPKMTELDRGFEYRHVVIRDDDTGTIIDPTALAPLSFTGYHLNYIFDHFPKTPSELVGDVRITEFADSPEGTLEIANAVTEAVMRVQPVALNIRDKLFMYGGQPYLDMAEDEIRSTLTDLWDMKHYRPYPEDQLTDEFKTRITAATVRLLEIDDSSV